MWLMDLRVFKLLDFYPPPYIDKPRNGEESFYQEVIRKLYHSIFLFFHSSSQTFFFILSYIPYHINYLVKKLYSVIKLNEMAEVINYAPIIITV